MSIFQHHATLLNQLNNKIKQEPNAFIPSRLPAQLTRLHELSINPENRLTEAISPLLERFCLLSLHLLDKQTISSHQEKKEIAQNILECAELIATIITDPQKSAKALATLQEKQHSGAFELRAHQNPGIHYPLAAIDALVNGVNSLRSFVFSMHFHRCTLSAKDFISEELHRFILHAEQSSTRKLLSSLSLQSNAAPLKLSEKISLSHLGDEIQKHYSAFYREQAQNHPLMTQMNRLLTTLDEFAEQSILAKNNEVLNAVSAKAFLASQDLVLELLAEKNPSIERIEKLNTCLEQTVRVIKAPGQKDEVYQLDQLIKNSDYKRLSCDKERTCYAIIHILVSVALLSLAIVEAAVFHSVTAAESFWTIAAEVGSVGVGIGQLHYYSDSQIKNTLFAEAMGDFSKASRLKTAHSDWRPDKNANRRRTEILQTLQQEKFHSHSKVDQELQALLAAMNDLQSHIKMSDAPLLHMQALSVLHSAEDLTIDILRAGSPSLQRIQKLHECIRAADKIVLHPDNQDAIHDLVALISQGDYESKRLIKRDVFIGALLLFVSIALYAITITGTIFSGGATAGTILSPFMLSIMAINKLNESNYRETTPFTDKAKAFSEYAQLEEHTPAPSLG